MSLTTHATVQIAAAPAQVFAWLVEPARLTTWLGGSGGMPEDTAQLHVGWTGSTTMAAPSGGRPMGVEITAYDPPRAMATTVTYAGGRSVSSYTLVEKGGGTEVSVDGETDYASFDEGALDANLTGQPAPIRWFAHLMLHHVEHQLADGDYDDVTEKKMNDVLGQTMARLKALVETPPG